MCIRDRTWTLGLAKSDANLAVAQRENSVILYESDYKTRYAGFNPNSAESYIIFEFMQDKYMEQSVHLASLIQKQFRHTCKRVDRGVHPVSYTHLRWFDLLMGTDTVRKAILAGKSETEIRAGWKTELQKYKEMREKMCIRDSLPIVHWEVALSK